MFTVLYYISSHGFGHAVRSAQVIKELIERENVRVVARTCAPAWLLPADDRIVVEPADVDPGPHQKDSMTMDVDRTHQRFAAYVDGLPQSVEREMDLVQRFRPDVIVADIAPLGVAVGAAASIPSVVVANFLWDWILSDAAASRPALLPIADALHGVYEKADRILRTPLSGGLEGYTNVTDIPLITRKSPMTKDQARADLGLPDGPLALVSVGGVGLDRFFDGLGERVTACGLVALGGRRMTADRIRWFDRTRTSHEQLLAASDVALGKMGYGLCAELIATKRSLLYTARNDFIEFKALKKGMARYVAIVEIPEEIFYYGSLDDYLERAIKAHHPEDSPPIDGAQTAARMIRNVAIS